VELRAHVKLLQEQLTVVEADNAAMRELMLRRVDEADAANEKVKALESDLAEANRKLLNYAAEFGCCADNAGAKNSELRERVRVLEGALRKARRYIIARADFEKMLPAYDEIGIREEYELVGTHGAEMLLIKWLDAALTPAPPVANACRSYDGFGVDGTACFVCGMSKAAHVSAPPAETPAPTCIHCGAQPVFNGHMSEAGFECHPCWDKQLAHDVSVDAPLDAKTIAEWKAQAHRGNWHFQSDARGQVSVLLNEVNRLTAEFAAEKKRADDAEWRDKHARRKLHVAHEEIARLKAEIAGARGIVRLASDAYAVEKKRADEAESKLLPHTEQTQCVHVDALDRSMTAHAATTARLGRAVAALQTQCDEHAGNCASWCMKCQEGRISRAEVLANTDSKAAGGKDNGNE
jgi:hypothetical protein